VSSDDIQGLLWQAFLLGVEAERRNTARGGAPIEAADNASNVVSMAELRQRRDAREVRRRVNAD
jgi:hypothetical protein